MVLSEEGREQVVGQVVVPGDVRAGVLLGVPLGPGRAGQVQPAQFLQRFGHQLSDAGGEDLHHRGEVIGVPVAGHVGLAQADQSAVAEPGREIVRAVHGHHRGTGPVRPALPRTEPSG